MSNLDFLTTPEYRRRMADTIESYDPAIAADWRARAALQEQDREAEYLDALDAWRAREPSPLDFIDEATAGEIRQRRDAALAKARAEFEKLWGGFTARFDSRD